MHVVLLHIYYAYVLRKRLPVHEHTHRLADHRSAFLAQKKETLATITWASMHTSTAVSQRVRHSTI